MVIDSVRKIIETDRPFARKDPRYWWLSSEPYPWSVTRPFPLKFKILKMDSDLSTEIIVTPEAILFPQHFDDAEDPWLKTQMATMNFDTLRDEYKPERDLRCDSAFRVLEQMSQIYTRYFNLRAPEDISDHKDLYNRVFKKLLSNDNDARREAIEDFAKDPSIIEPADQDFFLPQQMDIIVHANKASHLTSVRGESHNKLVLNFCLTYTSQYWPPNQPSLIGGKVPTILSDKWSYAGFGLICN